EWRGIRKEKTFRNKGYAEVIIQANNLENVISIRERKLNETNRVADTLAKMALINDEVLHMFEEPSLEIKEILKEDCTFDNLSMTYSM
ncbi:hypothetical protein Gogos_010405, partial [Gossypium gossypioides]|nr:hypothetical protein [Gossypium gossypioides]